MELGKGSGVEWSGEEREKFAGWLGICWLGRYVWLVNYSIGGCDRLGRFGFSTPVRSFFLPFCDFTARKSLGYCVGKKEREGRKIDTI